MMGQRSLLALAGVVAALCAVPAGAAWSYSVDNYPLGERVQLGRDFRCVPAEQGTGFTWCQRERQERGKRSFMSTISILRNADGNSVYLDRMIEPAFFGPNDMASEIARLSNTYFSGERPREISLPPDEGRPAAVIAVWGKLRLEPLDAAAVAKLAEEDGPRQSMLVDHLGDVKRSAQLKLPVFRIAGGAGYLWSASMNANGRGHLRFLAADMSMLAAKAAPKIVSVQEVKTRPVAAVETKSTTVAAAHQPQEALEGLTAPATVPAQSLASVPVGEIPANTTVRAKSNVEHTGSIAEGAPAASAEPVAPIRSAKDQAAFGRTAAVKPAPAAAERTPSLLVWIGIAALTLFALAFVLDRWRREPTGLELLEWQKRQEEAEARPERSAWQRFAQTIAVEVRWKISDVRVFLATRSERLHHLAVKHGMSLALLAGIAKAALQRRLTPAARA